MKNTSFCKTIFCCALSKDLKVAVVVKIALRGLISDIPTIMIGKIEIELPAMYMMRRFMGIWRNLIKIQLNHEESSLTPFTGPSAQSHDFLIISWLWSVSRATSLWLWPAARLNPGGEAKSEFLFLKFQFYYQFSFFPSLKLTLHWNQDSTWTFWK